SGNICIATIVSACITVVSPDGELVEQVPTGDIVTTNICFGGPDRKTAYITRSSGGTLAEMPWARPGLASLTAEWKMDFLFYCRDKPGVGALLEQHVEAHWSFTDGYGDRLLTRGPTLSDDGEEHTGSLHIVRLDGIADTAVFAYQEPF